MSQVGSLCDKVDYYVRNFVGYLSADFTPVKNLRIYGDLTYTWSKADADNPDFGNPFDVIDLDGHEGPSYIPGYDPWFAVTYTGNMGDMSDWYDLKMERVDASLGFDWNFWKDFSLNSRFTYRKYDDEEVYLEDDTDGEAYIMNVGLTWKF